MKDVADLPSLLETFFTRRLIAQRKASPHTIASYRDAFRLLLQFAERLADDGRLECAVSGSFPGSSGEHSRKRRSEPQSPFDCPSIILPLCCFGIAPALRTDPTRLGDSQ
jgi:hypothetical protein